MTWGNEPDIAWRPSSICVTPHPVPMLSPTPPPALRRRGCTVPGEGWSPAETEHSGEAPRRRRSPLRWRVRSASPLAAAWIGTRTTRGDRGQSRGIARRAQCRVVLQRRPSVANGEVRSGCGRRHPGDNRGTHDTHHDTDHCTCRHCRAGTDLEGGRDFGSGDDNHRRAKGDAGNRVAAYNVWNLRARSGNVVRRGFSRKMCQPDTSVRNGLDGDQRRHGSDHDMHGR